VSFTPELSDAGPPSKPNRIPVTAGLTLGSIHDTVVFPFNNVEALEQRLTEYAGSVAAIIVEPVILNMGCTLPKPGYLREVRELCNRNSVLLIFDEAKTGAKIAYGGAPEYSGVAPDITCLAKAVGGGFPIGAIAASRDLMKLIGSGDVWQTGSFAANSISVAAGIATLRDVLTREVYSRLFALNQRLAEGYRAMLRRHEIEGCVQTAGVTSSVFFTAGPVHNYRDSCKASPNAFMVYWYGMLEHSIIPQTYGRDDAWTLTVAHTQQDVDSIIAAFDEIGFQITCVQSESAAGTVRPG